MPKFLITHKKKVVVIGGLIAALCFVLLLALILKNNRGLLNNIPTPTATSSGQQSIDTSLSLAPSSTPNIPPQTPIVLPPSYSGCKLDLNFSITGGDIQKAGIMNYALVAKNIGDMSCQSASISVYYADGEAYVSASPAATADGYYWRLGNLLPGNEIDIAITTTRSAPLASGNVTDEACLSADNGADACNNSLTVESSTTDSTPAIASSESQTPISIANSFASSSNKEAGVWVWTSLSDMTSSQMQQVINEAAANNFTAIYITLDEYLTISNISDATQKQEQLQEYDSAIAQFLALAAQKNIAVDAEAGGRDWAEPQNTWEAGKIMAFVASYNQTHAQKFRGVQYDIEPYLLPQYNNDESIVLTQYIQLIDQLVQQDKNDGLQLGIVVPHFYDSNEAWTPQVTVDGITDYTYGHILRLLNELPTGDGRILIMAYRNFASGSDSTIALSQQEIKEADATNIKIIVAQETGPVTPSYVTFYGTSRAELFSQIGIIDATFASDSSFAGIAIDYLDPYLELQ